MNIRLSWTRTTGARNPGPYKYTSVRPRQREAGECGEVAANSLVGYSVALAGDGGVLKHRNDGIVLSISERLQGYANSQEERSHLLE